MSPSTRPRKPVLTPALALGAALLSVTACGPPPADDALGRTRGSIVNGEEDPGHPAVGVIFSGQGAGCTATLVGKRTVLTAAHCITVGGYHVFAVGGERWDVDKVLRHPDYVDGQGSDHDVALAVLAKAPPITPIPITVAPPELGQIVELIGFGATASDGSGGGTKRIAKNAVAKISATQLTFRHATGGAGNFCHGDSGGPTVATINHQEVQVGIHAFLRGACGLEGVDMRVDVYRDWIVKNAGGDVLEGGHVDDEAPTVSFESPSAGEELFAELSVVVKADDAETAVAQVELLLDGKVVATTTEAPYRFDLEVPLGEHTLEARATDLAGNVGKATLEITVSPETPPESPDEGGCRLASGSESPSALLIALAMLLAGLRRRR